MNYDFYTNGLKKAGKVAIIHEWLKTLGGSEVVTSHIAKSFEKPDVYSLVNFLNPRQLHRLFDNLNLKSSFVQYLPFSRNHFRFYLAIFPLAVKLFNLKKYKVIISSQHAFAHGIRKNSDQLHISYCHTPMRYIWDLQHVYLEANNMHKGLISFASRTLAHFLRKWDYRNAQRVNYFISNSKHTAKRVKNCYNREATVIYPPVDVNKFSAKKEKGDYYLTASRLVCYKKVDLIVKAFNEMPDKKLIVIGDGKYRNDLVKMANSNIVFLPHLPFDEYHEYLRNAKAFVFAG